MEVVVEDSLSEIDELQREVVKSFFLSYADFLPNPNQLGVQPI